MGTTLGEAALALGGVPKGASLGAASAQDLGLDPDPASALEGGIEVFIATGDGDGDDSVAPAAAATGQDEWTPPTREEYEAMTSERDLLAGLLGSDDLDAGLNIEGVAQPAQPQMDQAAIQAATTPKQFQLSVDPGKAKRLLEENDPNALGEILLDNILAYDEVARHNTAIQMNQAVVNALNFLLPVHLVTRGMFEKMPELRGEKMRQLIEGTATQVRAKFPNCTERQLAQAVEKQLSPVIEKARKIMAATKARGAATRKNVAPAPSGGGQVPGPRSRPGRVAEPDAESRIRELEAFNSGH